jgi:hypothetical protein
MGIKMRYKHVKCLLLEQVGGFCSIEELKENGVDIIIDRPEKLLEIFN